MSIRTCQWNFLQLGNPKFVLIAYAIWLVTAYKPFIKGALFKSGTQQWQLWNQKQTEKVCQVANRQKIQCCDPVCLWVGIELDVAQGFKSFLIYCSLSQAPATVQDLTKVKCKFVRSDWP